MKLTFSKLNFHKPHPLHKGEGRGMLALSVAFSVMLALCVCMLLEGFINKATIFAQKELAEIVSRRVATLSASNLQKSSFTDANIFYSVIRMKKTEAKSSADSLVLKGTLPRVGAWISTGGEAKLILVRQEISGWTLEDVSYGKVLLSHGSESVALYMSLANGATQPMKSSASSNKKAKIDFSAVRKAGKDKEGYMPREVLDKLLMNPYDEISKMKMSPAEGGGMKLERVDSGSVLGLAGVEQGDVIKAVNGVAISNLGDLTNAINSMLSGSRFDVTVQRGGKALDLKYGVN